MTDVIQIDASQWIKPEMSVTESAEQTARAVNNALSENLRVEIDLVGVRGVPSSYFNLLLLRIAECYGIGAFDRVAFRLGSIVQQRVYERSVQAVREYLAA